jgi:Uma2 family endonuclease
MPLPATLQALPLAATPGPPLVRRAAVVIEDRASIPPWVDDLDTFRRWTRTEEFPEHGLFAYLQGDIWVDLTMEELLTHNRVKVAFTAALFVLLRLNPLGSFVPDRMRWTNPQVALSTEPDGLFHTWSTVQSGQLRFVEGARGGIIELEGTPDMVLEIVSATSFNKDTVRLRELYWRAGVSEYWLVDARSDLPRFEILRHTPAAYVPVEPQDGWLASTVLGHAFKLTRETDPLGHPLFVVEVRSAA